MACAAAWFIPTTPGWSGRKWSTPVVEQLYQLHLTKFQQRRYDRWKRRRLRLAVETSWTGGTDPLRAGQRTLEDLKIKGRVARGGYGVLKDSGGKPNIILIAAIQEDGNHCKRQKVAGRKKICNVRVVRCPRHFRRRDEEYRGPMCLLTIAVAAWRWVIATHNVGLKGSCQDDRLWGRCFNTAEMCVVKRIKLLGSEGCLMVTSPDATCFHLTSPRGARAVVRVRTHLDFYLAGDGHDVWPMPALHRRCRRKR